MADDGHAAAGLAQPQPVRTAETATTGPPALSIVRSGPGRAKSAPAASARVARAMTWAWVTSL